MANATPRWGNGHDETNPGLAAGVCAGIDERRTGQTVIPFVLNDATGAWRLVFTDSAPGMRTERTVTLTAEIA